MTLKKMKIALLMLCSVLIPQVHAANDVVQVKIAYENHPGEPFDQVMHHWADLVKERSQGKIQFVLYPSSQLGSKNDVTDQAIMGFNVITLSDVGFLANYVPDLGILFGPYLTDKSEDIFRIYQSDWFKEKSEELASQHGIRIVMSNYLYGVRQLLSKRPINTPADLKGLKVRVPNNIMQIKAMEAMGATPTPMPLAEAYPALTQGIIDGVENPLAVLYGQKIYEQAPYLIKLDYLVNTSTLIAGEKFMKSLPAGYADIIYSTATEAGVYSQKIAQESDKELQAKMVAAGVTVIEPDLAPFKELAKNTYLQFDDWTPGLYENIEGMLKQK